MTSPKPQTLNPKSLGFGGGTKHVHFDRRPNLASSALIHSEVPLLCSPVQGLGLRFGV